MKYALNREGTELIPEVLHKYYRIDQRFVNTLVNGEMWFSNPDDFNDPYDSYLVVDINNTLEEIHSYLSQMNVRFNVGFSSKEVDETAKYWFENPSALADYLKKNREDEKGNKGIACFSMSDKILLMWSHYADAHKGACLSFDISKDPDFFALPFLVDYPEKYPALNFIRDRNPRTLYKHIIATKSLDWKYEEEVRIVRDIRDHGNSRGLIKFDKAALIEIKFGLRTNPKDIETIRKLLGLGYNHVKLFKAELKKGDFGIDFVNIN